MTALNGLTACMAERVDRRTLVSTSFQVLLERDRDLEVLAGALEYASAGQGRIVLVCGEAGIGKTSFVDRFIALRGRGTRTLKGYCDALSTPSPLAPLHDIARQAGGRLLAQLVAEAPRPALFAAVLDQLHNTRQPTVLVVEDIHWADEATLDLIRYLSRRIAETRALLVLTWRDEVDGRHPLRALLGDLATLRVSIRIDLPRLSVEAVRRLIAGLPFDAEALHRRTSGNPFFVAEVLANSGCGLPATVRDAVLARVAALGPAGRGVLQAAAVIGSRMDLALLESAIGANTDGLALCMKAGMLEVAGDAVAFRHELVREAVLADLDPAQSRELHRRALEGLKTFGAGRSDLAQLAHFAVGAGDGAAVLEFGPAAARAAIAVGAHRVAAAQFRNVLAFAGKLAAAERARLFEAYAEECSIIDELAEATRARQEAIELWQRVGDRLKEGETLAAMAWPLVRCGRNAAAEEASRRAVEVLEQMPPTPQLAAAYRIRAHLRMLDRDRLAAVHWGGKAIDLATQFRDDATIAAAEMVVGSALLVAGDDAGRSYLDRSAARARQARQEPLVGLAYLNLGSSYAEQYRFSEAEGHLVEGIAYTGERDLDHANHYMWSWLALTRLYQGHWSEAAEMAATIIGRPNVAVISRIMALVALGRVRTRRGEADALPLLDEALELALQTDTLQRLAPVRAARAEAAWFAGRLDQVVAEADAAYELATRHRHGWYAGEFSFWRWKAGERVAAPAWNAAPFLLHIEGDLRGAAEAWKRLRCPYEQARALADGDLPAQLAALAIFDKLGAAPAAAGLRQRMRSEGTHQIPRGPRATTRRNPFGLTARELEILDCLADGLSNGRTGQRLHISPKTVDHHVSSVLSKLDVATRGDAARVAREQNLLA